MRSEIDTLNPVRRLNKAFSLSQKCSDKVNSNQQYLKIKIFNKIKHDLSQVLTCLNSTATLFSFSHNKVIKSKLIFSQRKRKTGTKHRSDTLFCFTIIQVTFT